MCTISSGLTPRQPHVARLADREGAYLEMLEADAGIAVLHMRQATRLAVRWGPRQMRTVMSVCSLAHSRHLYRSRRRTATAAYRSFVTAKSASGWVRPFSRGGPTSAAGRTGHLLVRRRFNLCTSESAM